MVALLTPGDLVSMYRMIKVRRRVKLTRGIIGVGNKSSSGSVLLRAGVEDELIGWDTHIGHGTRHVVGRTIDDEVTKERLPLPECAVERIHWVQLVEAVEERLLGIWEELLQIHRSALGGKFALVAEVETLVAVSVDEQRYFAEVSLLPFIAWEIANDVSVNGRPVIEIAKPVDSHRASLGITQLLSPAQPYVQPLMNDRPGRLPASFQLCNIRARPKHQYLFVIRPASAFPRSLQPSPEVRFDSLHPQIGYPPDVLYLQIRYLPLSTP